MSSLMIAPVITKLYNCCLTPETFPGALKLAEIIPLYKKGPKELCCNYRPRSYYHYFPKFLKNVYLIVFAIFLISINYSIRTNLALEKTVQLRMQFLRFATIFTKIGMLETSLVAYSWI